MLHVGRKLHKLTGSGYRCHYGCLCLLPVVKPACLYRWGAEIFLEWGRNEFILFSLEDVRKNNHSLRCNKLETHVILRQCSLLVEKLLPPGGVWGLEPRVHSPNSSTYFIWSRLDFVASTCLAWLPITQLVVVISTFHLFNPNPIQTSEGWRHVLDFKLSQHIVQSTKLE